MSTRTDPTRLWPGPELVRELRRLSGFQLIAVLATVVVLAVVVTLGVVMAAGASAGGGPNSRAVTCSATAPERSRVAAERALALNLGEVRRTGRPISPEFVGRD